MLRSLATEQYQVGAETTAGTGVDADKRYLSLTKVNLRAIEPKAKYSAGGSETPTGESQEKVYSEFDGEGPICYNTLPLILNACLGNQAASPYTWTPSNFGVDTLKTFTLEKGSPAGGEKAAYCVVKGFRQRFTKKDASINFAGFGRKLQPDIEMTADPDPVPCVPVDPKKVQLLIGDDVAGLAAVNWQEIELVVGDRWAPHMEGNTSTDSFEEPNKVRNAHTITASFTASTAVVADLITASRNKERRCVRIKATSDLEFAAGQKYDLTETAMCMVDVPNTSEEGDDVVRATCQFTMAYDATFGGFLKIALTNAPAAP